MRLSENALLMSPPNINELIVMRTIHQLGRNCLFQYALETFSIGFAGRRGGGGTQ